MAGISLNSSLRSLRVPHLASIYRCTVDSCCLLIDSTKTRQHFSLRSPGNLKHHMSARRHSPHLSITLSVCCSCTVPHTEEVRLCSQQSDCCERRKRASVKWRHNSIVLIDCTLSLPLQHNRIGGCKAMSKKIRQRWKGEHDNKENGLLCEFVCVYLWAWTAALTFRGKLIFLFPLLLSLICILGAGGFLNCFIRPRTGSNCIWNTFPVYHVCYPWRLTVITRHTHTHRARLSCLYIVHKDSFWLH